MYKDTRQATVIQQATEKGVELRVSNTHGAAFVTVGKVVILDEQADDLEAAAREALAEIEG